MWASCRVWAPRNQVDPRPLTERTYRSSSWRTTQIVTGFRKLPLLRTEARFSSSAVPILLSSSLVHALIYTGVPFSLGGGQDLGGVFYQRRRAGDERPVARPCVLG